jgi:hypothetical protein
MLPLLRSELQTFIREEAKALIRESLTVRTEVSTNTNYEGDRTYLSITVTTTLSLDGEEIASSHDNTSERL